MKIVFNEEEMHDMYCQFHDSLYTITSQFFGKISGTETEGINFPKNFILNDVYNKFKKDKENDNLNTILLAAEWGWDDTEVRDKVYIWCSENIRDIAKLYVKIAEKLDELKETE